MVQKFHRKQRLKKMNNIDNFIRELADQEYNKDRWLVNKLITGQLD